METVLKGQIGIVGMGATGCSVLRWLLAQNQQPVLFDTRTELPAAAKELAEKSGLTVYLGELKGQKLAECQTLIVSPGLAISTPAIAFAQAQGAEIMGDVELFCRVDSRPRIAITGSNGKSTVTTLVTEMLNHAGVKATAIGNIGLPVMDVVDSDDKVLVMELSSFQLETTTSLKADVACYLNVSADHLDRYPSFAAYAETKSEIFNQAKLAIWNRDESLTQPLSSTSLFSEQGQQSFGLKTHSERHWCIRAIDGLPYLCRGYQPLLACSEMAMLGAHNRANALAALACVTGVGVQPEAVLPVLTIFTGLAHRCETVLQEHGLTWVNDSKATNEGATLAALQGLVGSYRGKLILLAGGDGKGADFVSLTEALNSQVDELICFGKDGTQIAALKTDAHQVHDLAQAVSLANELGQSGDLILLSPACASLDQFPNYVERGLRFAELARAQSATREVSI